MALYLGSNKKDMISGIILGEGSSGGVQLPTLTNEGNAKDLLAGKQLINSNGNVVTGILVPGTGDVEVEIVTTKLTSNSTSISFTELKGEPSMFSIHPTSNITLSSTRYVTNVTYDGNTTHGIYGYRASSSATSYYSASYFTWTYNNGTLTVRTSSSTNGGNFSSSVTYQLNYVIQTEASDSIQLPTLTNVGSASDLLNGKQLIDDNGNIITGKIQSKSATTYTPTTYNQTISSGVYLSGTQTIKGDNNLIAENIKNGVSIFGVTGTMISNNGVQLPTLTNAGSASDLLNGKQLIDDDGNIVTGTMVNNGTVNIALNTNTTSYTIPAGYHSGSGKVSVDIEDRTFTPTKSVQNFTPNTGKVIRNVTINSIPDEYIIPSGTKTINTNGTHDVSNYASVNVNIASSGSSGFVVKSGTTTSGTIDTGLSDVEQFFIYKESQTATGLIHLHYTKSATSRMYASAWSTNSWGTKTITNGTGGVTVSGGTVTISATQAAQGALSSGVTYKWIAVGAE